jgi:hypothetical protein
MSIESNVAAPYLPPTGDSFGNFGGASPYGQVTASFAGLQLSPLGLPLASGAPVTGHLEHGNLHAGPSNAGSLHPGKAPKRSKSEKTVSAAHRDTQLPKKAQEGGEARRPEIEDAQSKVPAVEALVEKPSFDSATAVKACVSLPAPPSDPGKPGESSQAHVAAHLDEDETKTVDGTRVKEGEDVDLTKESPDTTPGEQAQQFESMSQMNVAVPSTVGGKGARAGKGVQKGEGPAKSQTSDLDQVTQPDQQPKPEPATLAPKEKPAANKGNRSNKFTVDQIQDRKRDSLRIPTPLDFPKSKERTGVTGMSYAQKAAAAPPTPTAKKTPGLGPSAASEIEPARQSLISTKEAEDASVGEDTEGGRHTEAQATASDVLETGGTTQLTAQPVVQDASQKDGDSTAFNLGVAQNTQLTRAEDRNKTDNKVTKA